MPPFSSALNSVDSSKRVDVRDRVAKDFLISLSSRGADIQNNNLTAILSTAQTSAGAYSVTPDLFEKAMATFAVRRVIKGTWLNNRDQYLAPSVDPLPEEFVGDCTVYAMFHQTNQTASIKDVEYKGKVYQIINEFYPFLLEEVKSWPCSFTRIQQSLYAANTDRFGAKWLSEHTLSTEAQNVLEAGKEIYKLFYEKSSSLPWPIYKISMWDCGWYQIRMALQEKELGTELFDKLKTVYNILEEKIRPLVFKYGFLETPEEMFEEV